MTYSKSHTKRVTEQDIKFSSLYFYSSALQSDHNLNSLSNWKRLRIFKHFLIVNHSHISKTEKITVEDNSNWQAYFRTGYLISKLWLAWKPLLPKSGPDFYPPEPGFDLRPFLRGCDNISLSVSFRFAAHLQLFRLENQTTAICVNSKVNKQKNEVQHTANDFGH